jgi:dTDP-4-amino-4,6-dideoxygalactose transaminase
MLFTPRKIPTTIPRRARALLDDALGREPDPVGRFEAAYASLVGREHGVVVGSARAAFVLWARAVGLDPGSGAQLPSYTAPVVPALVRAAGLRPTASPVEPCCWNLDPERLEDAPAHTAVVLVVHTEGVPARVDRARQIADARGWLVVEDCAHALLSTLNGRPVGGFGHAAYASFGKGKQVNAVRGGILLTDDAEVAARARRLRHDLPATTRRAIWSGLALDLLMEAVAGGPLRHVTLGPAVTLARLAAGRDLLTDWFEEAPADGAWEVPRADLRAMAPLFARFGVEALTNVTAEAARRRELATVYRDALGEVVRCQQDPPRATSSRLEFAISVPRRDALQRALLAAGIDTQRGWMVDWVAREGRPSTDPLARALEETVLYLPTYPALKPRQAAHIAGLVERFTDRNPKRRTP